MPPSDPSADPSADDLPQPRPDAEGRATAATSTAPSIAEAGPAGADGSGGLRLLPTPVAGLGRRALLAVAAAAIAAALLPLEGPPGIGFALVLLVSAGATLAALERPLDRFGVACCAIATLVATQWAVTDAAWVLAPVTLGAVLLAGLGIWGPHRFGEAWRALLVGPLLAIVAPLALARGARSQRGAAVGRVLVPVLSTVVVLLVFGGLLGDADAVFARVLDAVTPDVRLDESLVVRTMLAVVAAVVVTTYVLVQRAGTVASEPWSRPVRPRADWAVPLAALDVLLGAFVIVQLGVLFGGDERVQETLGLTYAEYAREGFGQLLVVALLTLGIVAIVVRVAADGDRGLRDRLLGALVGLTMIVLASSVHRLTLYTDAFGLSRLRISAYAVLLWVAVLLVLVVVAGTARRFTPHLPRTAIVVTGALAFALVAMQPDAVIARVNLGRAEAGADLDTAYLAGLSADATPVLVDRLPSDVAAAALGGAYTGEPASLSCSPIDARGGSWNLARWRALRAIEDAPDLEACRP